MNIGGTVTGYVVEVAVQIGQTVDFVVDPIFDGGCDDTLFTAILETNGAESTCSGPPADHVAQSGDCDDSNPATQACP